MDFVFWIIVIVLIVGIVWWLLNRSSSAKNTGAGGQDLATPSARPEAFRTDGALAGGNAAASAEAAGTAGIPSAAGFGRPAEPMPPTTADDTADLSGAAAGRETAQAPEAADAGAPEDAAVEDAATLPVREDRAVQEDQAEWETQWSEASGSPATPRADNPPAGEATGATGGTPAGAVPVHHPEYTDPHTPTLPGAETAAVEGADEGADQDPAVTQTEVPGSAATLPDIPDTASEAETTDRAQPSAAVETAASDAEDPAAPDADYGMAAEPAGHLAADEPYGQGSASPAPDGSGPTGYTVKGDAGSMVYYEEGHPDYEQTRAEVWFESAAHAEAAGFRSPKRNRL